MKTKLQLIRKVQFGFGALLAVLLVIGVVSYRSLLVSAAGEREISHTYAVLESLERLQSAMENIETGYGEFALSGEEAVLRLAQANAALVEQERRALRVLTADNADQQRRLASFADFVARTTQLDEAFVRLHHAGGPLTAAAVIRKERGARLLDEFRAVVLDMKGEERRLLIDRSVESERRFRQTKAALILGSASGLLIVVVAGWIVQRDYAARERAEAALLEIEERFRIMVEGVQDYAIFMLDPQGKVVSWNTGAERIKGYKADEIVGQNFSRFYPQEDIDRDKPEEELRIAAASGRSEAERWLVRKDGSRFWANLVITAVRNSSGSLLGFSEISRDISERKQAQAAFLASEERFRVLVEGVQDYAILMLDPHGKVISWNAGAERIKGYKAEEIIGQNFSRFYPQEDIDQFRPEEELQIAAASGRSETERWRVRKDGSRFWANLIITAARDSSGNLLGFYEISRDITERKRFEEHLVKTMAELKRSNDELGQFAYIASHDLQEPLRMVASYTQLLAKRYKGHLDADANEFIDYAVDGCNRMQGLIQDLLAYSRAGASRKALREISSESALQEALANLQATVQESGAVVTHDSLPRITTDDTQLVQIFQNVVGNAIKYRSAEVPRVHVSAAQDAGNEWVFSVRDNGMGIDPQYFERIFVLFQRLHGRKEFAGTGIGLAVCKKILEKLGGRIWVESQPQKGSTFHFALPKRGVK